MNEHAHVTCFRKQRLNISPGVWKNVPVPGMHLRMIVMHFNEDLYMGMCIERG
jgi:hypothetical protein